MLVALHKFDYAGVMSTDSKPTFDLEHSLIAKGVSPIVGIDEAGRGPWAGPVVAAAVILDPENIPDGLNDSKKLTEKKRDVLFDLVIESASVGIGKASVNEIDRFNIFQATFLAMQRAVAALPRPAAYALVDGKFTPDLPCPSEPVIKGDSRSLSIAAASVIAKVTRDRLMIDLAQQWPGFAWERNKGYGTAAHQAGLATHGVTQHHRRSFKPITRYCVNES